MAVALRPLVAADGDALFAWMSDPGSVRMAAFATPHRPRADFDAWLARLLERPHQYGIVDDGALVGWAAAYLQDGAWEVTYWVDAGCWGRGIASAALALLVAAVPHRPLHARVASANTRSLAVLRRAGFVETGRAIDFAPGVGAEVEELTLRLD